MPRPRQWQAPRPDRCRCGRAGLGARPELWMETGRALPSPGVQRDPVEPRTRSGWRWFALVGARQSFVIGCQSRPPGGIMWRRKKKKPPPRGVWRLEGYAIWHPRRFGGTGFGCRAENALSTILFRGTGRKPWRLAWHLPRCVPCSHGRDRPPAPRARSLASVFHRGARAVAPRGQRAAGSHFVTRRRRAGVAGRAPSR